MTANPIPGITKEEFSLKEIVNRGAVASLCLARAVYALNWYNVAAIFALIALDFKENVAGLGILAGSFYLGVGIFQVPGGIIAAKYGPHRTAVCGILASSFAALLTAFAINFYEIILLRFLVGTGMALFFAPGVILIAKYFRRDSEGLGVGTFNSSFYIGGAFGLFGWAVLAEVIGWRPSLMISGALGIATGMFLLVSVPRDTLREGFLIKWSELRKVLADKWLLLLTLELFGISAGQTTVTTFMVYYLENSLNIRAALAGVIGGVGLLFSILSAPTMGRAYDRTKDARKLLFLAGLIMSIGVAMASYGTIWSAFASTILVALSAGAAYTVAYAAAREGQIAAKEYETLAVSWVNSIQLLAGFFSPIAFSLLVLTFGYSEAWLLAGLYTLALISIILLPVRRKLS